MGKALKGIDERPRVAGSSNFMGSKNKTGFKDAYFSQEQIVHPKLSEAELKVERNKRRNLKLKIEKYVVKIEKARIKLKAMQSPVKNVKKQRKIGIAKKRAK
jgi:hypothetical protein